MKRRIAPEQPSSGTTPPGKVHIPPARGARPPSPQLRVSQACEPCRRRKAKCDAKQPVCSRCSQRGLNCRYGDSRRLRKQKHAHALTARVSLYSTLLQETLPYLAAPKREEIQDTIFKMNQNFQDNDDAESMDVEMGQIGKDDEWAASARVGSPNEQDRFQHDKAGIPANEGYLGKASVVSWLDDAGQQPSGNPSLGSPPRALSGAASPEAFFQAPRVPQSALDTSTYYAGELDLSTFGQWFENVEKKALPSKTTADAFLSCYFATIHRAYPVVVESAFRRQYDELWQSGTLPVHGSNWLAMLNVMFAIGVLGMESVQSTRLTDENHHLAYFIRARLLQPESTGMLMLPRLEDVQLSLLLGKYFAASYQIERAWHIAGRALRYAQALALHLVDSTPAQGDARRALEISIWHSACGLELFLAFLTGRPACFSYYTASTPLPLIRDTPDWRTQSRFEGSSTPPGSAQTNSLWVGSQTSHILLDRILADILFHLYTAGTVSQSWGNIQQLVSQFSARLERWRHELPPGFKISHGPVHAGHSTENSPLPEKIHLAMRYFSTQMMIHRPCLCRGKPRGVSGIPDQSDKSRQQEMASARACVSAARYLIMLFPEEINILWPFTSTPWWASLHYILQAGAILILEIMLEFIHARDQVDIILADVRKILSWLQVIAQTQPAAERAWVTISRFTTLSLSTTGKDTTYLQGAVPADILEAHGGRGTLRPETPLESRLSHLFSEPEAHPATRQASSSATAAASTALDVGSVPASSPSGRLGYAPVFPIFDIWATGTQPSTSTPSLPRQLSDETPEEQQAFGFE